MGESEDFFGSLARRCPHCGQRAATLSDYCPSCGEPYEGTRTFLDRLPIMDPTAVMGGPGTTSLIVGAALAVLIVLLDIVIAIAAIAALAVVGIVRLVISLPRRNGRRAHGS